MTYNSNCQRMENNCYWNADHRMVSVQIVDENAPQTGNENATQVNESNNIHNSNPTLNRRIRSENSKKIIKAVIKVASLNMRGFGHNNPNYIQNKWKHVNKIMRNEKIAILLLQETHMNVECQNKVQMLFERRLNILCSEDPESPT